jgi:superfamily II helicase
LLHNFLDSFVQSSGATPPVGRKMIWITDAKPVFLHAVRKQEDMNEDEKVVVHKMIRLYCRSKHHTASGLCDECLALDRYAMKRLDHCRFGEEKPTCGSCPIHCYKPDMRERIKKVMRFAGPRMLLFHPLDAFSHLYKNYQSQYRFKRKSNLEP